MGGMQQKSILQKTLPEELKLSIAKKIENHLFSKVLFSLVFSQNDFR
jgi:hypothetical protein